MEDVTEPVSLDRARRRLRPGARRPADPQELVVATIAEHAEDLLRVARRYTGCAVDAEDAYQRALEVFVKRAHRLDPQSAYKWLFTVVKHEALAVREQRARLVGIEDEQALDRLEDGRHLQTVEERSEGFEDMLRAAEALRRCKPQEVTALVLKAQGLSYQEIADRQGWTYTKVNRCLTEGRRSFLRRYAGIEAGEECSRWAPVLSAMADGEATAAQLAEARPHLRNCPACRAMLGDLHRGTQRAAALMPAGLMLGGGGGVLAGLLGRAGEALASPVLKVQGALEAASASKVAAVAASAAAIAGGGVAVERQAGGDPARAADRPATVTAAQPPAAPGPGLGPVTVVAKEPGGAARRSARTSEARSPSSGRRPESERPDHKSSPEAAVAGGAEFAPEASSPFTGAPPAPPGASEPPADPSPAPPAQRAPATPSSVSPSDAGGARRQTPATGPDEFSLEGG